MDEQCKSDYLSALSQAYLLVEGGLEIEAMAIIVIIPSNAPEHDMHLITCGNAGIINALKNTLEFNAIAEIPIGTPQ